MGCRTLVVRSDASIKACGVLSRLAASVVYAFVLGEAHQLPLALLRSNEEGSVGFLVGPPAGQRPRNVHFFCLSGHHYELKAGDGSSRTRPAAAVSSFVGESCGRSLWSSGCGLLGRSSFLLRLHGTFFSFAL